MVVWSGRGTETSFPFIDDGESIHNNLVTNVLYEVLDTVGRIVITEYVEHTEF